jgi:hypothetical protein
VLSGSVYGGTGNQTGSPAFTSQYCNGSRTPPEAGGTGWQVPPGTNETNAFPNPVFNLTPAAVVDEGNNWVNLRWGPLSLYPVDPTNTTSYQGASPLANYAPQTGSSAINAGAASVTFGTGGNAVTVNAPKTDFYGNTRPAGGGYDIGAVESQAAAIAKPVLNSITPSSGVKGSNSVKVTLTGTGLSGATVVTVSGPGPNLTVNNLTVVSDTSVTATFGIPTGGPNGEVKTVTVTTPGGNSNGLSFTVN